MTNNNHNGWVCLAANIFLILTSLSRDGEIQAAILERFGYQVARGSTSQGAARGLIQMIRGVRSGLAPGFAVDGPRGPRYRVKPGVVLLARKTGAPIIPATARSQRARFLDTWAHAQIRASDGKATARSAGMGRSRHGL